MVVVIANDLPPAVRGRMKLWFIEPRPNVFVSGLKDSVADEVTQYLYEACGSKSGIMVFKSINRPPYYSISSFGGTLKTFTEISGLQLIIEKEV